MIKLDEFTNAYIVCALWSSYDDNEDALDSNYTIDDISEETLNTMVEECKRFQIKAESFLDGLDESQSGHDFWLTRNRHGTGFWDRGHSKLTGETLTKMSQLFGEVNLCVGDDGKIYQGG